MTFSLPITFTYVFKFILLNLITCRENVTLMYRHTMMYQSNTTKLYMLIILLEL